MSEGLKYRSPEWVAEQLDIDKSTVYRFLKEGRLPALQLGKKWLISEPELRQFLQAEQAEQTTKRRVEDWVVKRLIADHWDLDDDLVVRLTSDVYNAAELAGRPLPDALGKEIILTNCPICKNKKEWGTAVIQYSYYISPEYSREQGWNVVSRCYRCETLALVALDDSIDYKEVDAKNDGQQNEEV